MHTFSPRETEILVTSSEDRRETEFFNAARALAHDAAEYLAACRREV